MMLIRLKWRRLVSGIELQGVIDFVLGAELKP